MSHRQPETSIITECIITPFSYELRGVEIVNKKKYVEVTFDSGGEYQFSFDQLRALCPCSDCQAQKALLDSRQRGNLIEHNASSLFFGHWDIKRIVDFEDNYLILEWVNGFGTTHKSVYTCKVFCFSINLDF